jgi:hypothetical protein
VVEEMYVTGPPNGGVGVTIVAWDYAGRLLLGLLSFADSVEDPGELAAGLRQSLAELVEAAEGVAPAPVEKSATLSALDTDNVADL